MGDGEQPDRRRAGRLAARRAFVVVPERFVARRHVAPRLLARWVLAQRLLARHIVARRPADVVVPERREREPRRTDGWVACRRPRALHGQRLVARWAPDHLACRRLAQRIPGRRVPDGRLARIGFVAGRLASIRRLIPRPFGQRVAVGRPPDWAFHELLGPIAGVR